MSDATLYIRAKDTTAQAFDGVNKGLGKMSAMLGSTQAKILGLVGVGGFGALVKMSFDAAKETTAYANALNMSTQEMQAWQHAAGTVNIEGEKMADIMKDVSERTGDALANNAGEALEVMERMNLSAAEMATLSPDQQLLKIAEGLGNVGTQAEKVQILESLGSDLSLMLPLLDNNAEKLNELRDEAIATGVAMNDIDAAKMQAANESMSRAQSIAMGVGQTIAIQLSPYIEAIATQFAEAAAANNGFKDQVIGGTKSVVKAIAFLGDAWRGIEVIWAGLELVFWAFISTTLGGLQYWDNAITDVINLIPGLDVTPSSGLAEWAETAAQKTLDAQVALHDLAMQPLPGDTIEAFFKGVEEKAAASAAAVVANRAEIAGAGISPPLIGVADEKLREEFDKLNLALKSETDRLILHNDDKIFIAEDAFQAGLITDSERMATLEALELDHQKKLNAIKYQGLSDSDAFATAFADGDLQNSMKHGAALTKSAAGSNKKMFNLNKEFTLANAVMEMPGAVMSAFAKGGGYPWGLIPAALTAATSLSHIADIKKSTFTSTSPSSSASGGGGGSYAPDIAPDTSDTTQEPAVTKNIYVIGTVVSPDGFVRDVIAPELQTLISDEDLELIPAGSRQYEELQAT